MRKILSLFALSTICFTSFSQSGSPSKGDLKLWYDKPADKVWEAALPVGNGRIAGMVYGNPSSELIKLNEGTIWSGGPNRNDNPKALAALPEISFAEV